MNQERLYKVILSPYISEKATIAGRRNEHIFRVAVDATKAEVKAAIEFLFNVKVRLVRIVNVGIKKKIFRGIEGHRKGWKKAYVALKADQKLDIIEAK